MKHFHIGNEKKRLAHEIYNLTGYLESCEKQRKEGMEKLTNGEAISYKEWNILATSVKNTQKEIVKTKAQISTLQKKHDAL